MSRSPARPLLAIVGPTAVGKTDLSLSVARRFDGEVVSADSRLFYQGMDIGTAKPGADELATVRHHLIDIVQPDVTITLGQYQQMAYAVIDEIQDRRALPILVGGTGQYVMAVLQGWGIPRVPPRPRMRQALREHDPAELHRWLAHLDPVAAERIHPNNRRRTVRALEVTLVSGQPISELQRKSPPPYQKLVVGLHIDRDDLYARIDERVDNMLADGLVDEVASMRAAGFARRLPAMSGLGYRQIWDYLEGETTLPEAVQRIKFETHRFVRQQNTWFHRDDPSIHWFNPVGNAYPENVFRLVDVWLDEGSTQSP